MAERKKVTGIGGIFFKCKDPEKMKNWYKSKLGLATDEYGSSLIQILKAEKVKQQKYHPISDLISM